MSQRVGRWCEAGTYDFSEWICQELRGKVFTEYLMPRLSRYREKISFLVSPLFRMYTEIVSAEMRKEIFSKKGGTANLSSLLDDRFF